MTSAKLSGIPGRTYRKIGFSPYYKATQCFIPLRTETQQFQQKPPTTLFPIERQNELDNEHEVKGALDISPESLYLTSRPRKRTSSVLNKDGKGSENAGDNAKVCCKCGIQPQIEENNSNQEVDRFPEESANLEQQEGGSRKEENEKQKMNTESEQKMDTESKPAACEYPVKVDSTTLQEKIPAKFKNPIVTKEPDVWFN